MTRPVILCTGSWSDLPLELLAQKAGDWGYQGLDLSCWGDHFEVQRALSEAGYCQQKLDLLTRSELTAPVVSNPRVGQAVCDPAGGHQAALPDYVWGDGQPAGVGPRAAEEMMATVRAAEKLGAAVVAGRTGSPAWPELVGYPPPTSARIADALRAFTRSWNPILDVCRDCGIRFALEVQPGQVAFDIVSAEMALDALHGREELGFTFDPTPFHWQGIDPVEFLRRFPDRIYHVHVSDAVLTLNGRNGILTSYLPSGDPRRGWDYRSPGHGGVDWEAVMRGLNAAGYTGPLAVDWHDPQMDREHGAEDACKFVKRLDFPTAGRSARGAFQDS